MLTFKNTLYKKNKSANRRLRLSQGHDFIKVHCRYGSLEGIFFALLGTDQHCCRALSLEESCVIYVV